jgi:hypothetical protein
VWHHIDRGDFVKASELQRRMSSGTSLWGVCEEYELRELDEASHHEYSSFKIVPKYPPNRDDKWRLYHPVEDTPDLFLKFARLYRGSGYHYVDSVFVSSILDWVHQYGLSGYGNYSYYGGQEEILSNYAWSAYWAAGILAMYEAALNGDEEAAKAAVLEEFLWVDIVGLAGPQFKGLGEQRFDEYKAEHIENLCNGDYLGYALDAAKVLVELTAREESFPTLYPREVVSDPSVISAGWGFKSLFGAMYLQMYWLMASGGDVTRCEHCGQIISLVRPHPGGRKRRSDKRYCDDACRQAHHRSKKRSADSSS